MPKKRMSLVTKLGNPEKDASSTLPLFQAFLRLPDQLVNKGHFRAEVMRRVKATREEESKKIRKLEDEQKGEERREKSAKQKNEEREKKLKGLSADEQKRFLEKEREKNQRKRMGKQTMKG